jgi:hypothetical protein
MATLFPSEAKILAVLSPYCCTVHMGQVNMQLRRHTSEVCMQNDMFQRNIDGAHNMDSINV